MARALVLSGGGVAGIAWELGVLLGLTDADPTLSTRAPSAQAGREVGRAAAARLGRRAGGPRG